MEAFCIFNICYLITTIPIGRALKKEEKTKIVAYKEKFGQQIAKIIKRSCSFVNVNKIITRKSTLRFLSFSRLCYSNTSENGNLLTILSKVLKRSFGIDLINT